MRSTFNVNFVCRPSKVTKSGKAPVEMSIIINGKRVYLQLPRKEDPEQFRKAITSKRMNPLKEYLELMYQKVMQAETELAIQGMVVTPYSLKAYIQNGCSISYTIKELFDDYLKLLKKRVNVNLTAAVYRKYEIVRDLFFKAIDSEKQVTEITNSVISNFYADLNIKYESTTSAGMMVKLKTIITYAIDNGKLKINPFSGIKIAKKTKEVELFTVKELERMLNKKFVSRRVEKVRDLFCFAAGSGLAFCDCMSLQPEDFCEKDGEVYIQKTRQKTGTRFTSILTCWAREIAVKYNYDLSELKISNQKTNQTLKDIQDSCEITSVDSLTFHKARHFYITYLIASGVPVSTVKELVGHSNIAITNHYTHLKVDNLIKDFKSAK